MSVFLIISRTLRYCGMYNIKTNSLIVNYISSISLNLKNEMNLEREAALILKVSFMPKVPNSHFLMYVSSGSPLGKSNGKFAMHFGGRSYEIICAHPSEVITVHFFASILQSL